MNWRRAAPEALGTVNLAESAGDRPNALTGREQQRVAIALVILRRPALLIPNEPAASLDTVSGRGIMDQFSELRRKSGITLIFISHDMAHSREVADRVIALRGGRVLFDKPRPEAGDANLAGMSLVQVAPSPDRLAWGLPNMLDLRG